jgi:adenylate kinase family enzyme
VIQHSILGQAGSGKSTFIDQKFGDSKHISFSVGSLLRKMLSQSGIADSQHNTNAWESANPLVYSTYDNLCLLSDKLQAPLISDGFPRNGDQVIKGLDILKQLPATVREIQLHLHMLDIPEKEQIRRIKARQGMDDYQLTRIKQSRSDFEDVVKQFARQKQNHNLTDRLSIQFNWWKATDGGFEILNIS